ncbi:MAG: hypothetical protein NC042_00750 [Ruminococcus flavefaciens]|nr:hypothetical protein [Ruminococcus flavefaciens]
MYKNDAGILTYVKEFLCKMAKKRKQIRYKADRRSLCGVALALSKIMLENLRTNPMRTSS